MTDEDSDDEVLITLLDRPPAETDAPAPETPEVRLSGLRDASSPLHSCLCPLANTSSGRLLFRQLCTGLVEVTPLNKRFRRLYVHESEPMVDSAVRQHLVLTVSMLHRKSQKATS